MRFGSVCSGIEAASVAWKPLGWQAAWFSEIEPFPLAVLAHHYPTVPNHGDMMTLPERILAGDVEAPDLLCGGTPCQAFSVAGLRRSLDDARGNLSLTFCELADAIDTVRSTRGQQPAIVFWENVPGVLSTADNAFGCFLGKLAGADCELKPAGKRWTDAGCVFGPARAVAWRILDAQYFGLAQRRRRVFVVASARAGFDPAAVLFESEGVRRDFAPSRQPPEGASTSIKDGIVGSLCADSHPGAYSGQDAYTGRLIPHAFDARQSGVLQYGDKPGPLDTDAHSVAVLAFAQNQRDEIRIMDRAGALAAQSGAKQQTYLAAGMAVRRLTPRECERLQGFPDDYTAIPWRERPAEDCPDGPRYKALGNSWAVPVVRWIGQRISKALVKPAERKSSTGA